MGKLVKVFDPDERERQLHYWLREHQVPGLLRFLARLPYGAEAAFLRGVAQLWVLENGNAGDIDDRVNRAIDAGGGLERSNKVAVRKPRGRAAHVQRVRLDNTPTPVPPPAATATTSSMPPRSASVAAAEASRAPEAGSARGTAAWGQASNGAEPSSSQTASDDLSATGLALLDEMSTWAS